MRVFPDVASLPLRPPALLAKTAATLDQLSGGRFELGLGAGAFWDAIAAMGGPVRQPGEAVAAVEEAIAIIRAMWSGSRGVRYQGTHYQIGGVRPGPLPAHEVGIWLGAYGPRMLNLTGRLADGWVPSLSYMAPGATAQGNALIDAAARQAGREPAAIRRILNINGEFAPAAEPVATTQGQQIVGPVAHWLTVLSDLATDEGFASFVLWTPPEPEALRRFIQEVAPAVRERVAERRAASALSST